MTPIPDPIAAIRAEVAQKKERAEQATPGVWREARELPLKIVSDGPHGLWAVGTVSSTPRYADAKHDLVFIAAARSDVPRLVALVEALCEVIDDMNCQACGATGTRFNHDLEPVTCNECGFAKLAALTEEGSK